MIYTSNYARQGKDENAYGISCTIPDWFPSERHLRLLAPTWDLVDAWKKKQITEAEYTQTYIQLITSRVNVENILQAFSCNDDMYLLCYESPGQFCHRRVLAELIETHTSICIPEWKNEKEQQQAKTAAFVDSIFDF